MRALVYTAPGEVTLRDYSKPPAVEGQIEVSVGAAGICGSDVSGFLGHSKRRVPPLILGHELVGRAGDSRRVVVNPLMSCGRCRACLSGAQNICADWKLLGMDRTEGCFAEFVAVPESQLYEIPEDLPDSRAIIAEPLANIVHMFRMAAPAQFCRLGIVGCGTIGALALLVSKHIGIREVAVLDVSELRIEIARGMGAALAANVSSEEGRAEIGKMAGNGFDMVLDASGTGQARQTAFDLCRPGGTVVLLGMASERSEINFVTSIRKEHRAVMSFAYTPVDFERSLSLIKSGAIDLTPWTIEMPLEEGQQAFERITRNPGSTLKMMLRVN
jgi:2-desacetyl-2-hydroxyethyl bacteriochlorophyllide A dehydrogenase